MTKLFSFVSFWILAFGAGNAFGATYRADFSSFGCEEDGCGYESLSHCLAQLTEQKELFEFSTGLKADVAFCDRRKRIERYYPVLEGKGEPEKKLEVTSIHTWRGVNYAHLLAEGIQRVIQGEGGRIASYFVDEVKFSSSGSTMLRVFFYFSGNIRSTRYSDLPLSLTAEECKIQKKYLEKQTFHSPLTPHASVFCDYWPDVKTATLLITAQKPESMKELFLKEAGSFASFSECLANRTEILKLFPDTGVAVICKKESDFSAYALLRNL